MSEYEHELIGTDCWCDPDIEDFPAEDEVLNTSFNRRNA